MPWSLQKIEGLSDEQFSKWRKLLESKTGIHLGEQQSLLLQTALNSRMRAVEIFDYDEYYHFLGEGLPGSVEWCKFVDNVTVNETRFFREEDSFVYVDSLLTETLIEQSENDAIQVWCVGCSTGEEPYSLAMLINDSFEKQGIEPRYGITATDISLGALAVARLAKYKSRLTELLPTDYRDRYCVKIDEDHDQISSELRDRVCFTQGNVVDLKSSPIDNLDIIFCHNMLIYFRRWRRKEILQQLVKRLKPGGVLVIGLGEMVDWEHPELTRVENDSVQAYMKSKH